MKKTTIQILIISLVITIGSVFLSIYPDFENVNYIPILFLIIRLTIRNCIIIYFMLNYTNKIILILGISSILWFSISIIIIQFAELIKNYTNIELVLAPSASFLNYLFVVICIYLIIKRNKKVTN